MKTIVINPSGASTVLWLHGLGADGHDFEPVVQLLNLPHIRFILPHAPYRPITLNNGYAMRAWYDIIGLQPDSPQDEAGIRQMQAEINTMIAQERARGIAPKRIVLAGFSQGGAMALHTATRYPETLGGILALSTYLPLRNLLHQEKSPANQHTPIWMAHGTSDQVIALSTAQASKTLLQQENYAVEWHTYAMAHGVNPQEIEDIRHFLLQVLPA